MSHRKKQISKKKELERRREERKLGNRIKRVYEEHPKRTVASVVMILLVVFLVYQAATNAPPFDYTQCLTPYTVVQQTHFRILIQVGERFGDVNLLFIRVPDSMGVKNSCTWPVQTHANLPGERGFYYTKAYVEAPYLASRHAYTLGDFFDTWGEWLDYPRGLYFGSDGVSFYRSSNVEVWLRYGPLIDPSNETYTRSVQTRAFASYVPQSDDVVEIIVHDPWTQVACPYFPYTDSGLGCEPSNSTSAL